ncbi:MAG TPA: copper resistance protein CopC, partial [Acidimicrobiia bacterium]|nr:copper resistance protein CopC [Acidimicrobiia bacterium]
MIRRRPAARATGAAIVAAIVGLIVVGSAGPAAAHAVLEATEPAAGVSLERSPDEIVLRYTEAVDLSAASVRVFDARGDQVETGALAHAAGDPTAARLAVGGLGDGAYAVTWRVTSADGHPISGAFTFAVGDAAAATDTEGLAARLLADEGGSASLGAVYAVVRFLAFTAVLLVIGGCAYFVVIAPSGHASRATRSGLTAALVVGVLTAVAAIGLQGAHAAGGGLADALSGDVVSDSLGTRFGRASLVRAAALLLLVPLLGAIRRRSTAIGRAPAALGALGSVVALGTFAAAGHASTGRWVAVAFAADVVHLGAAALWFGGVVVLALAIMPRDVVIRATEARVALARFS